VYDKKYEPHNASDRSVAAVMEWEHDIKNGDRVYMYPVRYDEEHARNQGKLQAYFYRAMTAAEAAGWQAIASAPRSERVALYRKTGALAVQGHQGWASHRKYSRGYLKDDFTHLLEVHAPGFIEALDEIGISSGKAEKGDISWGMGLTCSNGFHPSREKNKRLKAVYEDTFTVELRTHKNEKSRAFALIPYLFMEAMQWAKLVNYVSVKKS
jgi:hypothetical protein